MPIESPDAAPPPGPAPAGPHERLESVARLLLAAVFVIFVGLAASNALRDLAAIATIPGEFSHGEAGKAFYAWRWKTGQSLFLGASEPPHYPSFHGPALHALVGSVAWVLDLSRDQMMGAGRAVSLAGLLGVCGVLVAISRILRLGWVAVGGVLLLFLSSSSTHMASAAFRPDTLMVLCSVSTCLVFLAAREKAWGMALLVALPVLGYLFKPLGLSAAAATTLAFLVLGEWKRACVYAVAFAAALLVTVGALQAASGGLFLATFAEGMRVEFGLGVLLGLLPPAGVAVPVAGALVVGAAQATRAHGHHDAARVAAVGAYLLLALAAALVGTLRAGAYFYYYLETLAFASPLALWGLARLSTLARIEARLAATAAACIVIVIVWRGDVQRAFTGPFLRGEVARALEAERTRLLETARAKGLRVFTNDPVLSVRLDEQAILYTGLMRQMIDSGALDPASYERPVRERRWPVMALLNERLPHNDAVSVDRLPGFEAIMALYEPVPGPGPLYRLYRLKTETPVPSTTSGS